VLLTKADQIDGRPGSGARNWDEVRAEIREVLGGAFQPGVDSRIIPVSIFEFATLNGQPQILTLEMYALADPVIFAAETFIRVRHGCDARIDYESSLANGPIKIRNEKCNFPGPGTPRGGSAIP